tara:strand:+ start:961 stop:1179 length:219 start_codon:yes stop_codon:yes gene_type:complete
MKKLNLEKDWVPKVIDAELKKLNRSFVATPKNRETLESFAKANQGSSDIVLTQMAVQFGYEQALKFIKQQYE